MTSVGESLLGFWRSGWDAHPERVALFVLVGAAYAYGVRRGAGQDGTGRHIGWFGLGFVVLVLTVQSPLHHLADNYLFSAHMVQHQLLTLVVPPLLLLGLPVWLATPLLDRPWLRRFGHSQYYPVVAFVIFNVIFSLIHFPVLYDRVFGEEASHFVTHVALLGSGLLTWMPLFSPAPSVLPRISQPIQMLYCVAQTVPGSLVGSLVALSERIMYSHYGTAPLALGIDPLADQQLGGLFMWVGTGTFFLGLLTVIFFVWAEREEKQAYG